MSTDRRLTDPYRDVRLARRFARLTSLLLLAWIAFFSYVMLQEPEELDPEYMPRLVGFGVAYALVIVAVVIGWRRERLAGRMLIAASLSLFTIVVVTGPSQWTTWSQDLIGAVLMSAPVLIVGVQFVTAARAAEAVGEGDAPQS